MSKKSISKLSTLKQIKKVETTDLKKVKGGTATLSNIIIEADIW